MLKKFRIALVLLLCLMVPAVSSAETEAYTIRVSDVGLSMGGYSMGELTGAALEAQFASIGEELATRFLLKAGEETALEANVNIGRQVNLFLQGMTNAYTVSMEDAGLPKMEEMLTGQEVTAMMQFFDLIDGLDAEQYITDETTEEYEGVSYERTDFKIDNAVVDDVLSQMFAILDDSGAIGDSLRSLMDLSADASIAEMYAESGLSMAIEGAYWYAAENDFTYDVYFTLTQKDDPDTYVDIEFYFDTKVVDDAQTATVTLSLQPDGETQMEAICTFQDALSAEKDPYMYGDFVLNDYSDGEDGTEITSMSFTYVPDEDGYNTVYYSLSSMLEEILSLSAQWKCGETIEISVKLDVNEDGSVNSFEFSAQSAFGEKETLDATLKMVFDGTEIGTFALNYAGTRDDNGAIAGTAKLSMLSEGEEQIGLSMKLECGVATMDEEAFAIDANSIALTDMTDAERDQALKEANRTLADALTILETNVPAFQVFSMILDGASMS